MNEVLFFIFGTVAGAVAVLGITVARQSKLRFDRKKLRGHADRIRDILAKNQERAKKLIEKTDEITSIREGLELQSRELAEKIRNEEELMQQRIEEKSHELKQNEKAFEQSKAEREALLKAKEKELSARIITLNELEKENKGIKRDLYNLGVNLQKLTLDKVRQKERQEQLEKKSGMVAAKYLKENVEWIGSRLNASNYVKCRQALQQVIDDCREIGFAVTEKEEATLHKTLKTEFERVVRAALEREEQVRIKARIREEQALAKEVESELRQLEREREAIQAALEKALARAKDEHSEEIERLKARLAEAEEKSKRAISQAQLTKSGHVYVISNIGSLGDGVFKIGMTRRLEPLERIKELSDASVPFPFDVHMMISSEDAPKLENTIHHTLHKQRMNKMNLRKEFFKTDIEEILQIVRKHHGEVEYVADAEALQYHQSQEMSDEDLEFIENVYDNYEKRAIGEGVEDD